MLGLHPARMNDSHLARLFLLGLTSVGLSIAWLGVSPEELSFVPCLFHALTDIPCPGCGRGTNVPVSSEMGFSLPSPYGWTRYGKPCSTKLRVFPNAVSVCIPPWKAGEYRTALGPPL